MKSLKEFINEEDDLKKAVKLAKEKLSDNPSDEEIEKVAIKVAKMDGIDAQVYDIQKALGGDTVNENVGSFSEKEFDEKVVKHMAMAMDVSVKEMKSLINNNRTTMELYKKFRKSVVDEFNNRKK